MKNEGRSLFDSIRKWLTRSYHRPSVPMSSPEIGEVLGTSRSRSGEPVTVETSLTYSPVWQALDLISSDISRIPLIVYRRIQTEAGDGKERDRTHPAYALLRRHTGEMTSNMWLVRMICHALMYGNAYTRLRFNGSELVGFEWLHSDRVEVRKQSGQVTYLVRQDPIDELTQQPGFTRVPRARMFHLQGLALSQLGGLSIVHYARNTLGRAMAAESFGDDFYANGGPGVIFTHPGQLSQQAQKNFLSKLTKRHAGSGNRFKFGIVEEAMTMTTIGVNAEDAMLIDSLKFSVRDVARYFNIPPHKLGDDSRTSFNSTEQENMSYFNSSLGKWTSRIEFESNQKLFTPSQRQADSHFAEFKVDALFKANTIDRMNAAAIAVTNGIKSRNEVRAEENLNPYEGGEEFLTPLNMTTDQNIGEEDEAPENGERSAAVLEPVIIEAYERVTERIFRSCMRAANNPEKWIAWFTSIDQQHRAPTKGWLHVSLSAAGLDNSQIDVAVSRYLSMVAEELIERAEHGDTRDIDAAKESVLLRCRETVREYLNEVAI